MRWKIAGAIAFALFLLALVFIAGDIHGYSRATADLSALRAEVQQMHQERQAWIQELNGVQRSQKVIYDEVFDKEEEHGD